MLTQENAKILLRYYRTALIYLVITAGLAAILLGFRLTGNYAELALSSIATVHIGTLGALTLGIIGLYLRLFYKVEEIQVREWTVKTILILLNVGIGLLTLGFVLNTWPVLAVGFIGVGYAILWWAIVYFRWLMQAPTTQRNGALLFGAFGTVGLVISILLGGYLFHGYLSDNTAQNMRLAHIHAGLVGWASLGLLGIGIALRGGDAPLLKSIQSLQWSGWVWLLGVIGLVIFMATWQLTLVLIGGGLILLAFLGYGYSMPKVGKLGTNHQNTESVSGATRLLPYIIIGFIALFVTILLGFDLSINYPSGRAASHRIVGVGGWLLFTFLMALFSDIPRTVYFIRNTSSPFQTDRLTFLYPKGMKLGWIFMSIALLVSVAGYFISLKMLLSGVFLLVLTVGLLALYILIKYRIGAAE